MAAGVEREVWEGCIPAVITLADDELTTIEKPQELYVRASSAPRR